MADYGIKVAQPGYDVGHAGDAELDFSSFWPLLRVFHQERYVDNSSPWGKVAMFKHDLGYPPLFFYYEQNPTVAGSMHSGVTSVERAIISVDSQYIYWNPAGGGTPPATVSIDISFVICPIDLSQNYIGQKFNVGTSTKRGKSSEGIRVAKDTRDVKTHDLRDLIVDSEARSPMIHSITSGKIDGTALGKGVAYYDLPYSPMFLAYDSVNTSEYGLVNGFAGLDTSNSGQIAITGSLSGTPFSIVILKDPFTL